MKRLSGRMSSRSTLVLSRRISRASLLAKLESLDPGPSTSKDANKPPPPPPPPPQLVLSRRSSRPKAPARPTPKPFLWRLVKDTQRRCRMQQIQDKVNVKTQTTSRSSDARSGMKSRTGLSTVEWSSGWGRDALAPPSRSRVVPEKSRSEASSSSDRIRPMAQLPPTKKLIPLSSVRGRVPPPHHMPWVRQEEGYIKDVQNGVQSGTSNVLQDVKPPSEHKPITQLAHGLDRVLFNPGVHWLQDPRSRVYNFTPWLESIPKVNDFDFDRVTGFVKSSADRDLWTLAKQHGRSFTGSTSSLTGLLGHIYFLISGDKVVDTSSLTQAFVHQPTNFTPGQRMPTSVIFNYKDGVWSADSDKVLELAEKNVLTWMGTMLEKFLTVPEREFKTLLRSAPSLGPDADQRREAYRYAMSDEFVMRSQLDSYDPRLPGTGVFDIKTRAAVPIRLDVLNYEENSGYLIKKLAGSLESFEKEYYDLIRSAFLKYSFQARIGNMDGVLIAYHNTARIFGFQYVSLEEMEQRLYGTGNGMRVFDKCVLVLEKVLKDIVSIYGNRSIRCTFETREMSNELTIWVEPATWDEQIEGRPRPIKQLSVTVTNFLDGVAASGSQAIESDRPWVIRWMLTELGLDEADVRRQLEGARERQFKELNLPAGVKDAEEMEKVWERIDYGGERAGCSSSASSTFIPTPSPIATSAFTSTSTSAPTSTPLSSSKTNTKTKTKTKTKPAATPTPTSTSGETASASAPTAPSAFAKTLSFRQPHQSILHLRQLAAQGREETLREEAEGREKVVWGAPEGWHRVRDAEGGMLPDAGGAGDVSMGGVVVGDAREVEVVAAEEEEEERIDRKGWSYYM